MSEMIVCIYRFFENAISQTSCCVFLFLWFFCFGNHGAIAEEVKTTYSATVVSIIDGDSLEVRYNGKNRQIRLWGIDAPEWNQPHAYLAKRLLRSMLLGRKVVVEPYYLDDYKRVIAQVYREHQNINQLLIERGYAWVHIYYCKKDICDEWRKLQARARGRKAGLWGNRQAIPPWRWKRMKRR